MLKKQIISIDIGRMTTKIVIGKVHKEYIWIQNQFMISTPSDSYENGYIKNISSLQEIIQSVLSENKIKTKHVICTVQSSTAIVREMTLPHAKESDLDAMIYFEIEKYIPVKLDQYVVEYKILETFKEEDIEKQRILVVALPKKIIERYLELIQSLQLKPIALDLHFNGIMKAFEEEVLINEENGHLAKTLAFIDIGHETIDITIIERGTFKFNRLILQGGKEINENIANAFSLSLKEAEQKKIEYANLNELNTNTSSYMVNEHIKITIDLWIREIQRVFQYYTSREREKQIDSIYLYGGSSKIPYLKEYLIENLNIPTFLLKKVSSIEFQKKDASILLSDYFNSCTALLRK
ncbi:type IV pilus assembly protein PilM [Inediibacterium massiliense]|uniref:type IV pilus assembly protein PilM n=1 Tax=Inediibacterium massiliense TaxID=1658111 RepID=UPI0006B692BB|nr:type IV pilus assembly protein PilM [Inediibacterium massiliense]